MYSFYPDVQLKYMADIKPDYSVLFATVKIWTRGDITTAELTYAAWPHKNPVTLRTWTKRNPSDKYNFTIALKEIRELFADQIEDIHERSAFRNGFNKEVRRVLPSVRI